MKKLLKVMLILFAILLISAASMIYIFTNGMEEASAIQVASIDLSQVEDGEYRGEYKLTRWSNQIKVTVKDHKITALEVLDDVMFKMDAVSSALFERVIVNQSLDVDIETGATLTSHAYLKAIEVALKGE